MDLKNKNYIYNYGCKQTEAGGKCVTLEKKRKITKKNKKQTKFKTVR